MLDSYSSWLLKCNLCQLIPWSLKCHFAIPVLNTTNLLFVPDSMSGINNVKLDNKSLITIGYSNIKINTMTWHGK